MVIIMFFTFVTSVLSARVHFYHAFLGLTVSPLKLRGAVHAHLPC